MTWRRLLRAKYLSIEILPGPNKYKSWREYYDVIHTYARMYQVDLSADTN